MTDEKALRALRSRTKDELIEIVLRLEGRLANVVTAGREMERQRDVAQHATEQAVLLLRQERGEVRT